ncbi:hypothetical protein WDV06_23170 [Streptomyces racemochromogenes]|uniref:Uncharacterized protein n=1 Tax=Streptomyces racemochromogenes TaxID=67353 RepID=A0ABW7PHV7_9ACTN
MGALVELVEAGTVSVDISSSRPPSELADVHHLSQAGRTRGRVLIIP